MSADRRWRHVEVDFVADDGETADALAALAAQVEDLDRASVKLVHTGDLVCDACGQVSEGDQHACWLTPAVDPTALLVFLHELAWVRVARGNLQ